MTITDWRANKLADVLAKHAARSRLPPAATIAAARAAMHATRLAAAQLGAVTYAANHSPTTHTKPDGTTVNALSLIHI